MKPQTPVGERIIRVRLPTTLTNSRRPLQIRPFEAADWPALWALLEPVFRAGETFPHDLASQAWVEQSQAVMVAVDPAGAVCRLCRLVRSEMRSLFRSSSYRPSDQ